MKNFIICIFMILFFCECKRVNVIYFYSPDKSQCISVFNVNNFRYIANGKQKKIPKIDYVKVDMQNVDRLGDQLYICWQEKYLWDVTINKTEVIEQKLDTLKFHFSTRLPLDDQGIPTVGKYSNENCAMFDFYSMELTPNKGAIVEFK